MSGIRKLRSYDTETWNPPANLWEVLVRGRKDTFPVHTALWLFKNAQGGRGAFRYLPGPEFGYRARDGKSHSTDANNAGLTLQALSWFMCLPAFGNGYLAAGPTAGVYGGLSEGFLESPLRLPTTLEELPDDIKNLLHEATFPLCDLPTLNVHQIELYLLLRYSPYATIFGPVLVQCLRRSEKRLRSAEEAEAVERDLQRAIDRALQAFELPPINAWAYDRDRSREFVGTVRCFRRGARTRSQAVHLRAEAGKDQLMATSPYSPPFRALPIFDLRPLYREALRLVKLVPKQLEWCPSHCFMGAEDWVRLHRIVTRRKFSKRSGESPAYPSKGEQQAAWDWLETVYGRRVRSVLYPSDRSHH